MKLESALNWWRQELGEDHVITVSSLLSAAGTATFATSQTVPAIVRPSTTAEVQRVLQIANEFQVPVYPVSGGRNWGLGSRVPARDGCVLLDLGRLNRILDFNEALGFMTVEAGVTFRQASAFLEDRQSQKFVSIIGGSPDASLVANALERGDGSGPYGDRAEHVSGLEVVLPSGELLYTGFERFPEARMAASYRAGVGPSLDGLFMQSNLGVVTRLTVWLAQKPAISRSFKFNVANIEALADTIDAVRDLLARGTVLPNNLTIWNAYKFLALAGRYPWKVMEGRTPVSLAERGQAEPWYASGSLFGENPDHADALQNILTGALGKKVRNLQIHETAFDLGTPIEANLRTAYWRKRTPATAPMDPDSDRCGVIWLCVALPFSGSSAQALEVVQRFCLDCGFEPHVGVSPASPRALKCYVAIVYDREVPGEDRRAMTCHDGLLKKLLAAGIYPYRLGLQSMDSLPEGRGASQQFLRKIKQLLDPNRILAPGRYVDPT